MNELVFDGDGEHEEAEIKVCMSHENSDDGSVERLGGCFGLLFCWLAC